MRKTSLQLVAALAVSAAALAQSPLTTTFASNNGQSGNMFDLRATGSPCVVDDFDVNLDVGTWDIEVYTTTSGGSHVGIETDPTAWTLLATVPGVVSLGVDVPTPLGQSLGVALPCGDKVGFYVTVSNGTAINYTTGTGFVVGDVFASNADIQFLAGTGNVYPFGSVFGPPSSTRIFNGNIYYTTQPGQCALAEEFGSGCYPTSASYYEDQDPTSMDLGGLAVIGTNNGNGYDVSTAAATIAPVGPGAVILPLGDDDSIDTADPAVGGTLGLFVGSNCWIALGGGNSNGFTPSISSMLGNPSTGIYAWTDLRPASAGGLGDIYYEENGSVATVTYDGVEGWNTGLPNTVQFTYDSSTGDYSIAFGTLSTGNPEIWLVGYSTGGASNDPGATDISAGPFSTPAADGPGLALSSNVPFAGLNWDLQLDNINSSPFAVFFFGDTDIDPGVDLGVVGGAGCFGYTNGNLGFFTSTIAAGSSTYTVPVPASPAVVGAEIAAQGAAATTLNALGFGTSNGVRIVVGP